MGKDRPIGAAVVGMGLVGPVHARSLREIPEADLRVICDLSEERARTAAAEFGCDWMTDYASMLERPDVDLVCLTTPPFTHMDLGSKAAAAGKHVLVEKPIEINVARGRRLIRACRSAGVKLGVVFQSRWKKSYALLKRSVEEDRLGRLLLGDAYVKWYRPQEYYESCDWRGLWDKEGGGALINQGIHSIDALQWIMGPVESLFAYFRTTPVHRIEVEDLAVATLRFHNGALGVIEAGTALRPGLPERIEVHGEKGTVVIEGGEIRLWRVEGMDEERVKEEAYEPTGTGASDPMAFPITWHRKQIRDMVRAILDGREPAVNGEAGLAAIEIVENIYRSARTGQPVVFSG